MLLLQRTSINLVLLKKQWDNAQLKIILNGSEALNFSKSCFNILNIAFNFNYTSLNISWVLIKWCSMISLLVNLLSTELSITIFYEPAITFYYCWT